MELSMPRNIFRLTGILCILLALLCGCADAAIPTGSLPSNATSGVTVPQTGASGTPETDPPSQTSTPTSPETEPAHIHAYSEEVVPPECTAGGYTVFTCSCGHTFRGEETPATGHQYRPVVEAPTCTQGGRILQVCACGSTFEEGKIEPAGHIWSQWETVIPATSEQEGSERRYCVQCGLLEERAVATLPVVHIHSYASVVTAPTCTKAGYTSYICSCGDTYLGAELPATGHTYAVVLVAPTCLEQGYTAYTCHCGATYTDHVVEPAGHIWSEWAVIKEPTAETEGLRERVCQKCSLAEQETVERLPAVHTHSYQTELIAPTCTQEGCSLHKCACGDTYYDEVTAPKGHTWGDWAVSVRPTTSAQGQKERICTDCGSRERAVLNPLQTDNSIVFVFWTDRVHRNEEAQVRIQGQPGVTYDIAVFYQSGESSAKGLEDRIADADGYVTWTWKIGGRTAAGTYRIVVTGNGESQSVYFTVVVE